jgi:hypothetical protein
VTTDTWSSSSNADDDDDDDDDDDAHTKWRQQRPDTTLRMPCAACAVLQYQ